MAVQATVTAQGDNPTRVYLNQSNPPTVLGPGSSLQVTSPVDIGVEPGGVAVLTTADGSSVGISSKASFSLYPANGLPVLNAWDMAVSDTASGWAFRFSNLTVAGASEVDVAAPNASDGLTITAPDNTTLLITDGPFQNSTITPTWADAGLGTGQVQITSIVVVLQDQTQWTWTLGSGWSGQQAPQF